MKDYLLVMLDVDGTILSETLQISQRVKSAIRHTQELGVTVGLCTGRLVTTCQNIVDELQLDSYGVYYNGALLKNLISGQTLRKYVLPSEAAANIVRFARTHQLYLEVHTDDSFLYELEGSFSEFQRETLGIDPVCVNLMDAVNAHDVLKLQFVTESSEELDKINCLKQNNGHLELSPGKAPGYPDMTFINVIPSGISKGSGVREIAEFMGIDLEQVIAVGDSIGDIDAMEVAGLGVAMGNAEDEVKRRADYIAPSVWDDGVADVLERFILARHAVCN